MPASLRDTLCEMGLEDVLLADGFDGAFVGIVERCGQPPIAISDAKKCIRILVQRDGMTEEEAVEFYEFNVCGAWVGDGTPGWLTRVPRAR